MGARTRGGRALCAYLSSEELRVKSEGVRGLCDVPSLLSQGRCGSIFSQARHGAAEGVTTIYRTANKRVAKSYLNSFEVF